MIIRRSIKEDGNILPETYNLLHSLPEESLNYLEHDELHPVDIYNSSLERIIMAFLSLKKNLNEFESLKENPTKLQVYSVLEPQKELLHATQAHMDDCYRILKITSPFQDMGKLNREKKKKAERSILYWLNMFKHPSYSFFEEKTKNFRTSGRIVNKIKHHHARLRLFSMEGLEKSLGYYVEGKIIEGNNIKICPDTKIHPEFTAFSFSRDMAWNFFTIYIISHYLSKSLTKSLKNYYGVEIKPESNEGSYLSELKEISNFIEKNNLNYFPDEYKTIPLISFDDSILTMTLDSNYVYKNDINFKTIFLYQTEYAHVFHIIRPYIHYMQKRYDIQDFKEIPPKELKNI